MDTRAMDGLILGVEEQEKGGGFFWHISTKDHGSEITEELQ
jgi:hypothetical protein